MDMMSSWERKGWEEGIQTGKQEGKEELLILQLKRSFGSISAEMTARLNHLSSDQLNELGEDVFDFKTSADLETWLSRHNVQ